MAGKWKYYNDEAYNSKRREQKDRKCPSRANFLAAVSYIKTLLDDKNTNWAAFGGLAMLGLGSGRLMPDIHVVFDGGAFEKIRVHLAKDSRTRIPREMNALFPAKVLVGTGPSHKDNGCMEEVEIEVNLIPSGSNGTPPNDVLRKHQIVLQIHTESNSLTFKGLDVLHLVRTSLHYSKSLDLSWDPRKDIVFLCEQYPKEVASIRNELVKEDLFECLFWRSFFSVYLPRELQKICSQALLGLDRPPSPKKSLVPGGHSGLSTTSKPAAPPRAEFVTSALPSQVNEDPVRPVLKSYATSPLLSGTFHQQPRTSSFGPSLTDATQSQEATYGIGQSAPQPDPTIAHTGSNSTDPKPPVVTRRYYAIALSPNRAPPTHSRHSSQDSSTRAKYSINLLPQSNNSDTRPDRLRRPASFHSGLNQLPETYRALPPQSVPHKVVSKSGDGPPTHPSHQDTTIYLQPSPPREHPPTKNKSEYVAYAPKDRRTTLPAPAANHSTDIAYDAHSSSSAANSPKLKAQQPQAAPRSVHASVPVPAGLPSSLLPGGGIHKRTTSGNQITAAVTVLSLKSLNSKDSQVYELPASRTPKAPEQNNESAMADIKTTPNVTKDRLHDQEQEVAPKSRYTAYQPSNQKFEIPSMDFDIGNMPPHERVDDNHFLADLVAALKLSDVEQLTADPDHEEDEEEEDFT